MRHARKPMLFGRRNRTTMVEAIELVRQASADEARRDRVGSRAHEDRLESDPFR